MKNLGPDIQQHIGATNGMLLFSIDTMDTINRSANDTIVS